MTPCQAYRLYRVCQKKLTVFEMK